MRLLADLHLHSRYSRATSPRLTPPYMERWAAVKGIGLLGTGDCTHPGWLAELQETLEASEPGLFTLKSDARAAFDRGPALAGAVPKAPEAPHPRFVLTGEVSTIYKSDGRTRKVHHLVILPGFDAARAFQRLLEARGNIRSDGRPILGIDSRSLLALLLDAAPEATLIPAHIWTPWFSALGARSGFDSIEECYGDDLSPLIPAVETGLSSNPPMNWAVPVLDPFAIVSNSDAHSPDRIGREATILDAPLSYAGLAAALRRDGGGVAGTVEFFPQEGKYHYDGHRKCAYYAPPGAAGDGLCPVCGKPLTRGVMGRVMELAARPVDERAPCPPPAECPGTNRRPYHSLIPLTEILGELLGAGGASKKVAETYAALIARGFTEIALLMDTPVNTIEGIKGLAVSGERLALAIRRMRAGEVAVTPGYDGEYGVIRVFGGKIGGAAPGPPPGAPPPDPRRGAVATLLRCPPDPPLWALPGGNGPQVKPTMGESGRASPPGRGSGGRRPPAGVRGQRPRSFAPDDAQRRVIDSGAERALVAAGPGAGKTAVLTARIARQSPAPVLALTFTVKAAGELRERLGEAAGVTTGTFHSFCAALLREAGPFTVLGDEDRERILGEIAPRGAAAAGRYIEERKRFLTLPGEAAPPFQGEAAFLITLAGELGLPPPSPGGEAVYAAYQERLRREGLLDYDDLVAGAVRLLAANPAVLARWRERYRCIFVDEYQDVNFAQYALIRLLVPAGRPGPGLWVIGDPDQGIYGFRGADTRIIGRFTRDYPEAAVFEMTTSFRCAPAVVAAAGKLTGRRLEAAGAAEAALYRREYPTDRAEAEGIARTIAALTGGASFFALDSGAAGDGTEGDGGAAPEDCAVLLRTAALAGPVAKALDDHGLPWVTVEAEKRQAGDAVPAAPGRGVRVMTIHAAKGLEFDHVFVPALEEGLLPFTLYGAADINEERRILYVAMTRARRGLYLSSAGSRLFKGRRLAARPSRFLAELGGLVPLKASGMRKRARNPQGELF